MAGIRRHCAEHPHAADTLDGARRWWLAAPDAEAPLADVERALILLEEEGEVARRTLADGTTIYFCRLEQ